jgi:hypothetical protein
MKKPTQTLLKSLPSVEKLLTKGGYRASLIEKSKTSVAYALQGLKFKKTFFQVLTLTEERPGFVIVEIHVSNLSVTEKWVDVEVSLEFLPEFLTNLLTLAGKELSGAKLSGEKLEVLAEKIGKMEPELANSVRELHETEEHLAAAGSDSKLRIKLETRLGKIENNCLKSEMAISSLALRYFTNKIESIDPYFYQALTTINWSKR